MENRPEHVEIQFGPGMFIAAVKSRESDWNVEW